jgi:hypothetical protein
LLKIVPPGSSIANFQAEAKKHRWPISGALIDHTRSGTPTYFHDENGGPTCLNRGGPSIPSLIAEYGWPFVTSVEAMWLFDSNYKLQDVCIRRTTDAL